MKRWLTRLIFSLILLGLLFGPPAWLLGSEQGLQWLVAQAPRWVPGELRIASASGRLGGAFSLEGVEFRQAGAPLPEPVEGSGTLVEGRGISVKLGRLDFAWSLPALLALKLKIETLHLDGLDMRLPPAQASSEPSSGPPAMPEIKLPLKVELADVRLSHVRIQQGDAAPFVLDQADLSARAGEALEIPALNLHTPQFQIHLREARFGLQAPHPLSLKLAWAAPLPPGATQGRGELDISGDLREIHAQHTLAEPVAARLQATVYDPLNALRWQARLELDALRWPLDQAQAEILQVSQAALEAAGDLESYRVKLDSQLQGPQIPAGHWQLAGQGTQQDFVLENLSGDVLQGKLSASGQVAWQPALSARVALTSEQLNLRELWPDWPETLGLDTRLAAAYEDQQAHISELKLSLPAIGSALAASGEVDLRGEQPQIQASLNWEKLHWPLPEPVEGSGFLIASDQGQAKISGGPTAYQVELDTHLAGQDIPPGRWQFTGSGDDKHLAIAGLQGQILDGILKLTGETAWSPHLTWQLALDGSQLDPGKQWPDLPGKLALALESQGALADGKLSTQTQLKSLKGSLRGYPLDAQAQAEIAEEKYQIKNLRLKSGSAELTVDAAGLDNQRLSGAWRLSAPDLKNLLPDAGGSLNAQGKVAGTLAQPAGQFKIDGKALRFQDLALNKLNAAGDFDLAGEKTEVSLQAGDLSQGGQLLLKTANLALTGKLPAHSLQASVETATEKLTLRADGGFSLDQQTWRGQLKQLEAETGPFGAWRLAQPANLNASPQAAELAKACLSSGKQAEVCLQGGWDGKQGSRIQADLNQFALSLLKPLLPPETKIEGGLSGQVRAALAPNGGLRGEGLVKLSAGQVRAMIEDEAREFPFRGGELSFKIDNQGTSAGLSLQVLEQSGLQGRLALPGFNRLPLADKQPLDARLEGKFADLGILASLVPQVQNPKGELDIDFSAGGILTAPRLAGKATLRGAAVDLPDLGLELREISASARASGEDKILIDAGLKSGEGRADLQGTIRLGPSTSSGSGPSTGSPSTSSGGGWGVDATLKGHDLLVINVPDVRATASPDVSMSVTPAQLKAWGSLTLPQALITPSLVMSGGESGAVALSGDELIIGPQPAKENNAPASQPAGNEQKMALDAKIKVILGQDIRLEVADFNSRLGGSLMLTLKPGQPLPLGNGELEIVEGTYRSYGQDLEIKRGRIVFADSPVDNPGLNIKAVRRIRNDPSEYHTEAAGVHITGTAQAPELTLFTEPVQLEDREVLSYILTGKPFSAGDIDISALNWGTYLTPELYVSVGFSLFKSQSQQFSLRYELNEHWGVEGTAGDQDTGVDVTYTLGK